MKTLQALSLKGKNTLLDKNINDFLPSYEEKMKVKRAIKVSFTDEVPKNKVMYKVLKKNGLEVKVRASATMIVYKQQQVLQVMIEKVM